LWLSSLNLQAGYWDIFWPQLIQGIGMSLLFVPLTTVSMDPIPRERMGNATSLFNLMRNGIEAMQDQPRRELMVASIVAPGRMVEISVADTGPGDDVRSRLLQPFVTTKANGMGVGLSVCQSIVQLHGGRLCADDDTVGGGAVFRFTVRSAGGRSPDVARI
jgi:nitrogen-specific signal transduction histidine kinase